MVRGGKPELGTGRMIALGGANMARYQGGICNGLPSLSLEWPHNKSLGVVILKQDRRHNDPKSVIRAGFWKDTVHTTCDWPNSSRGFALGVSYTWVVGETPTCSVWA